MPPGVDVPLPFHPVVLHRLRTVQHIRVEHFTVHDLAAEMLELQVMISVAHHRMGIFSCGGLYGLRSVSSSVVVSCFDGS